MTPLHWKIWFLSSMGIFLDGFDLFVISIALPLVITQFSPGPVMTGMIGAAAVIGAVFGAAIGGRITDKWGRKAIYIIDLIFFLFFSIMTAMAWDVLSLVIFRLLLGIGIGADYPICASYVSEFMPAKNRGRMLIGAFSFQALGMFTAAGVGLLILLIYPDVIAWRLMLLAGCVPAIIILIFRLKVPESPRWYIEHGQTIKAAEVVKQLMPAKSPEIDDIISQEKKYYEKYECKEPRGYGVLFSRKYIKRTILASVPWFSMDIATYGIGVFTPLLIGAMMGSGTEGLTTIAIDFLETEGAAFLDIFLILGFLLNIILVERVGRIKLQIIGFSGMIAGLLILATTSFGPSALLLIMTGFIVFNLLMNMGPNATTFIIPAEIFPTSIRATGHGFAASTAKLGAATGIFLLPVLQAGVGLHTTLVIIAVVCLVGIIVTVLFGIETKGLSLEEIESNSTGKPLYIESNIAID
ncbi:MAG: MFS transporter [Methanomicrobiaceae archaeon]|nr:MFS transporter [Methanomicrobiaceae archaeon]